MLPREDQQDTAGDQRAERNGHGEGGMGVRWGLQEGSLDEAGSLLEGVWLEVSEGDMCFGSGISIMNKDLLFCI